MKELIQVTMTSAANFDADFEKARDRLTIELEKYNLVVTADSLQGCKKLATELNKVAADIEAIRKEKIAMASAPIREFDAKMKELTAMCKDGRQELVDQVKVFEDETRKIVKDLLEKYRSALFIGMKVKKDFQKAEFDDLIILSNLTKAGKLTSKATNELERRVSEDKSTQVKIENRLLVLENVSYREGLTTPLQEIHVKSFLYAEDDVYSEKLDALMLVEMDRQKKAEAVAQKKIELARTAIENKKDDEVLSRVASASEAAALVEAHAAPVEQEAKEPAPAGKKRTVIQATFEVMLPESIPAQAVIDKLKGVMIKAGITSLKTIKEV